MGASQGAHTWADTRGSHHNQPTPGHITAIHVPELTAGTTPKNLTPFQKGLSNTHEWKLATYRVSLSWVSGNLCNQIYRGA